MYPYTYLYWLRGRCRWFPWLPRWWWAGMYGFLTPFWTIPKSQEIEILESQVKILEQTLEQLKRRLENLRK